MEPGSSRSLDGARRGLLDWYEPRRSAFPWRRHADPYRVLVSEVMLQQTQASRVIPAYERFLERFPTPGDLAAASRAEVLRAWDGLGYNRRAVALSEAARVIFREHGGRIPRDTDALRRLPGVGPYTAAAVRSLAFGAPEPALDTNVRRVVARWALGAESHEVGDRRLRQAARARLDRDDPGAWNQALMDLGREVCRPVPHCPECPLAGTCRFRRSGRSPASPPERQGRFEGSFRAVRGAVVRALRWREGASLARLTAEVGEPTARVAAAVAALADEGIVQAGPAARAGRPGGRVRLAR